MPRQAGDFVQPDGSTSSMLLAGARREDPEAWQRMVRSYGPLVYKWARLRGVQPEDAADVVQDVFISVLSSLGAFRRRGMRGFRSWLWLITRRRVADQVRARKRQLPAGEQTDVRAAIEELPAAASVELTGSASMTGSTSLRKTIRHALAEIRDRFADHTWEAFWRTTVEGETASQAGKHLGMTAGAVRVAKYRVLRLFREQFGDEFRIE